MIKFNTAYGGGGYTYVLFRTGPSDPGQASWYSTGIQQSRNPIYADIEPQFPFFGTVTWQQVLDFVGARKIEVATRWEPHPDWAEVSYEERLRRNKWGKYSEDR